MLMFDKLLYKKKKKKFLRTTNRKSLLVQFVSICHWCSMSWKRIIVKYSYFNITTQYCKNSVILT